MGSKVKVENKRISLVNASGFLESPDDYAETPLGGKMTHDQFAVWSVYLDLFESKWGLSHATSEYLGSIGGDVFEAEFSVHGKKAYSTSLVLPIRNALYASFMGELRWRYLREMGIMTPVLDYGCGVGVFLLWLHHKGYKDLYGYELPGVQNSIMRAAFENTDIRVWDESPAGFKTIICLNVLEHVEHPVELLEKFYSMSNRVIADICIDKDDEGQTPHIAPVDELLECKRILESKRSLYCYEPTQKGKGVYRGVREAV